MRGSDPIGAALRIVYHECDPEAISGQLGEALSDDCMLPSHLDIGEVIHSRDSLRKVKPTQRLLSLLHASIAAKKVCLLTGPPASGKTSAVFELARRLKKKIYFIPIHAETSIADLLGGIAPTDLQETGDDQRKNAQSLAATMAKRYPDDAIQIIAPKTAKIKRHAEHKPTSQKKKLKNLKKIVGESAIGSEKYKNDGFKFIDGPLLSALKEGAWVLLDGVDLARPEVLERLNSLGERDSYLYTHELAAGKSTEHKLKPCEGFALICTTTDQRSNGSQLSESFKNRCIQIYCPRFDVDCDALCGTQVLIEPGALVEPLKVKLVKLLVDAFLKDKSQLGFRWLQKQINAISHIKDSKAVTDLLPDSWSDFVPSLEAIFNEKNFGQHRNFSGKIQLLKFELPAMKLASVELKKPLSEIFELLSETCSPIGLLKDAPIFCRRRNAIARLEENPEAQVRLKMESEPFKNKIFSSIWSRDVQLTCSSLALNPPGGLERWTLSGIIEDQRINELKWKLHSPIGEKTMCLDIQASSTNLQLEDFLSRKTLSHIGYLDDLKCIKFQSGEYRCHINKANELKPEKAELQGGNGILSGVNVKNATLVINISKSPANWKLTSMIGLLTSGEFNVHLTSENPHAEQTDKFATLDLLPALQLCFPNYFKAPSKFTAEAPAISFWQTKKAQTNFGTVKIKITDGHWKSPFGLNANMKLSNKESKMTLNLQDKCGELQINGDMLICAVHSGLRVTVCLQRAGEVKLVSNHSDKDYMERLLLQYISKEYLKGQKEAESPKLQLMTSSSTDKVREDNCILELDLRGEWCILRFLHLSHAKLRVSSTPGPILEFSAKVFKSAFINVKAKLSESSMSIDSFAVEQEIDLLTVLSVLSYEKPELTEALQSNNFFTKPQNITLSVKTMILQDKRTQISLEVTFSNSIRLPEFSGQVSIKNATLHMEYQEEQWKFEIYGTLFAFDLQLAKVTCNIGENGMELNAANSEQKSCLNLQTILAKLCGETEALLVSETSIIGAIDNIHGEQRIEEANDRESREWDLEGKVENFNLCQELISNMQYEDTKLKAKFSETKTDCRVEISGDFILALTLRLKYTVEFRTGSDIVLTAESSAIQENGSFMDCLLNIIEINDGSQQNTEKLGINKVKLTLNISKQVLSITGSITDDSVLSLANIVESFESLLDVEAGVSKTEFLSEMKFQQIKVEYKNERKKHVKEKASQASPVQTGDEKHEDKAVESKTEKLNTESTTGESDSKHSVAVSATMPSFRFPFTEMMELKNLNLSINWNSVEGMKDFKVTAQLLIAKYEVGKVAFKYGKNEDGENSWLLALPESFQPDAEAQLEPQALEQPIKLNELLMSLLGMSSMPDFKLEVTHINLFMSWKERIQPDRWKFVLQLNELEIGSEDLKFKLKDVKLIASNMNENKDVDIKETFTSAKISFSLEFGNQRTAKVFQLDNCEAELPISKNAKWRLKVPKKSVDYSIGDLASALLPLRDTAGKINDLDLPFDLTIKMLALDMEMTRDLHFCDFDFEVVGELQSSFKFIDQIIFGVKILLLKKSVTETSVAKKSIESNEQHEADNNTSEKDKSETNKRQEGNSDNTNQIPDTNGWEVVGFCFLNIFTLPIKMVLVVNNERCVLELRSEFQSGLVGCLNPSFGELRDAALNKIDESIQPNEQTIESDEKPTSPENSSTSEVGDKANVEKCALVASECDAEESRESMLARKPQEKTLNVAKVVADLLDLQPEQLPNLMLKWDPAKLFDAHIDLTERKGEFQLQLTQMNFEMHKLAMQFNNTKLSVSASLGAKPVAAPAASIEGAPAPVSGTKTEKEEQSKSSSDSLSKKTQQPQQSKADSPKYHVTLEGELKFLRLPPLGYKADLNSNEKETIFSLTSECNSDLSLANIVESFESLLDVEAGVSKTEFLSEMKFQQIKVEYKNERKKHVKEKASQASPVQTGDEKHEDKAVESKTEKLNTESTTGESDSKHSVAVSATMPSFRFPFTEMMELKNLNLSINWNSVEGMKDFKVTAQLLIAKYEVGKVAFKYGKNEDGENSWLLALPESFQPDAEAQLEPQALEQPIKLNELLMSLLGMSSMPDFKLEVTHINLFMSWKERIQPDRWKFVLQLNELEIGSEDLKFKLKDVKLIASNMNENKDVDIKETFTSAKISFSLEFGNQRTAKVFQLDNCEAELPISKNAKWRLKVPKKSVDYSIGDLASALLPLRDTAGKINDLDLPFDLTIKMLALDMEMTRDLHFCDFDFEVVGELQSSFKFIDQIIFGVKILLLKKSVTETSVAKKSIESNEQHEADNNKSEKDKSETNKRQEGNSDNTNQIPDTNGWEVVGFCFLNIFTLPIKMVLVVNNERCVLELRSEFQSGLVGCLNPSFGELRDAALNKIDESIQPNEQTIESDEKPTSPENSSTSEVGDKANVEKCALVASECDAEESRESMLARKPQEKTLNVAKVVADLLDLQPNSCPI
ncbi:hypothetical protein BOX15_Mlig028342g1 [Macrostomum lignano]|uniref:ATPase dynein-related AAA domain-containing protein n=1 Tax=Macrostomum lignano TaxID=282301 RepID=A0A267GIT3_9PLAT|nr:hypothetical protein BOX15_Mlig028342g1 [Macrostomum lignano]